MRRGKVFDAMVRTRFEPRPRGVVAHLMYPVFLIAIRREEKQNSAHYKAWDGSGAVTATCRSRP